MAVTGLPEICYRTKNVNMEDLNNWNRFMKSGSYNRSVKKYSDIALLVPNENVCQTENLDKTVPNLVSCEPSVSTKHIHCGPGPVDQSDEISETESDDEKSAIPEDYYSPDEDSNVSDDQITKNVESDLTTFLQSWSLEHNISHAALKPLLSRLSQYDRTLPEDPRRLLDTPRKSANVIEIQGGRYWHQGLGKSTHIPNELYNHFKSTYRKLSALCLWRSFRP